MDKYVWFIITSIVVGAAGQIILKMGANELSGSLPKIKSFNDALLSIFLLIKNYKIVFALILYGSAAFLWILVLTKFELSYVFPIMAANYIIIMILSGLVLGEDINLMRIIGTLLISGGVFLVAKGG